MFYGLLAGLLMDLFVSGPFGFYTLFYINMGYLNGICTKYYYEDYITLPLILSIFNSLAYNMYIYIFRFLLRAKLDLLFYFKEIMLPEIILPPLSPFACTACSSSWTGGFRRWKKERHKYCLTTYGKC